MPKDQYYKRLESLFSSDSVAPEPTNGKAAELNEVAALRAKVAELEAALAENAEAAGLRSRLTELEAALDERKRSAATRIGELEAALIDSKEQAAARLASLEATLADSREEAEAQRLELSAASVAASEAAWLQKRVTELETALAEAKQSISASLASQQTAVTETDALKKRVVELEAKLTEAEQSTSANVEHQQAVAAEADSLKKRVVELEALLTVVRESASADVVNQQAAAAEVDSLKNKVVELEATLTATEQGAATNVASLEAALAEAQSTAKARIAELETVQAQAGQTASARIASLESTLLETKETAESRIAELEAAQLLSKDSANTRLAKLETSLAEAKATSAARIAALETDLHHAKEAARAAALDAAQMLSKESYADRVTELETALAAKEAETVETRQRIAQLEAALAEAREAATVQAAAPVVQPVASEVISAESGSDQRDETIHSLEAVIEHLPFMLYMKDAKDLSFTRLNKAAEQLLGLNRTELLGTTDSSFFPEEAMAFTQKDSEVLNGGAIVDIPEELVLTTDKGPRLLHTRKVPIYGLDGKPKFLLGVSEDITDQKQAEQQLRLQALALETTANAVVITDQEGMIEWVNPAFTRFTGYTAEEAVGQHMRLLKSGHHDPAFYKNMWDTLLAGNTWQGEMVNRRKDGTVYHEDQTVTPVRDDSGAITHFVAVKQQIIHHASEQIDDFFENAFRQSVEAAGAIPYRRDHRSNQYLYLGEGIRDILGYPPEEVTTALLEAAIVENRPMGEAKGLEHANAVQLTRGGQLKKWRSDMRVRHRDGSLRWVTDSSIELFNDQGESIGSLGLMQDVTERRAIEDALRTSQARLSEVLQIAQLASWEYDTALNQVTLNDAFYALVHTNAEEQGGYIMPSEVYAQRFVPPEDEPILRGAIQKVLDSKDLTYIGQLDHRFLYADGRLGYLTVRIQAERDADGRFHKAHGTCQDITQRKLAEDALRISQTQLSEALRVSQLGHWEYDIANDLFTFNDDFYALLHTTAEQEGGYTMPSMRYAQKFVHPEDGPIVALETQRAIETTDPNYSRQVDHRFFYADGGMGYLSVRIRVEKDADGRTVKTHGTNQDITDRKLAEEALRASQTQLSEALRVSQLAYWQYDVASDQFTFNDEFYTLLHTTAEQEGGYTMPSGRYAQKFVHPDDGPMVGLEIQKALETTDPNYTSQLDHRFFYADGEMGYVTVRIRIEKDAEGRTIRTRGTNQDITNRKAAEEALRTSEARLSEALQTAKLAHWEYDVPNDQFIFNEQFLNIFHAKVEQVGGYRMSSAYYAEHFVYPDDLPIVGAEIEKALNSTDKHYRTQLDHRIIYADGGVGYISVRINIDRDDEGHILRYYGANQDITERKAAEEALRTSQAQLSEALRVSQLAYWQYDVAHDLFEFNDEFYALLHTSAQQEGGYTMSSGHYAQKFVYPEDAPLVGVEIQKALETTNPNYSGQIDHRLMYADGGLGYVTVRIRVHKDSEGRTVRTSGTYQDITARKEFEQALATQAKELETVAQVSISTATLLSPDELLQQVVDLTKSQFNLYHAHVYLLHEDAEELVLTAGADQVGRTMVAAGRRIALSQEQSLVARAARTRLGVTVNDVTADPGFLPNPLLPNTRSELATPLIVGNQVLGVLDVQSEVVNRFNEDDIRIHTILASQIAVALQNSRQYREAQSAMHELDSLTRRLTREGWQDYTAHKDAPISYTYDLNELKPLVAEEITSNGHALIEHPIVVRGQPIGRLAVGEAAQVDEETADIIAAVAERLSTHVDNLRLLEETETARQQLDRRALELEAIAKVSAAAATILNQDELLQTVADLTRANLELYHVHIYLLSEDGSELILAAGSGEAGRKEVANRHAISVSRVHSLVARVARTRQGVLSNDVSQEPDFLPNPYLPNTRSEVAVPMIVADTLIGVFDGQSDQFNRFTEEDVTLKTTLAHQVAVALQNARYFQEQSATVERLRELDQLKSSFLANMSHELRTPLNSILGFAQVMLEGIDGDITDTMENDLVIIQKNGQHLLNLISDILDMAKIEAGKMTLNPEIFDLREVFDEVLDITGPLARAKSLDLIVDMGESESLELYADRVRLRQVMINIVNNGIKFTDSGSVRVEARRNEAIMRIVVKDTGIGIPSAHLESIFQEFTQVDTSTTRKAGGTGLGLPISRHLIEMHGGRLWAESAGLPGQGSSLILELPVETPYNQ